MIFILEGADGSGKTTLANQLHRQTGFPVIHRTKPKDNAEKAMMMDTYLHAVRKTKKGIFDRCWYSEMVYGPIMRGASCISFSQMYALERQLVKNGAVIIHCTGPKHVLWDRCQTRGEDYIVDRHKFDQIYDTFEELFAVPHFVPVTRYTCPDMLSMI